MAEYDERGREIADPTPVSVPSGWSRPPTLAELVRQSIRQEFSRQAADQGLETFEEADDFDVDEEGDPLSPYEIPEGRVEPLGGAESLDGSSDTSGQEKLNLEPPEGSQAPSTDSGTVKAPAGKTKAEPS